MKKFHHFTLQNEIQTKNNFIIATIVITNNDNNK